MSKKLEQMRLAEQARWAKLSVAEKTGEVLFNIISAVVGLVWGMFCKEVKKQYKRR